jgi:hypothetical protein
MLHKPQKEQVAKMKRLRLIGVLLLVACSLGAVLSSSAQAESAPSFTIGGTRLIAGRTHNADARQLPGAANDFELAAPELGVTLRCTGLGTVEGVLLGSNPGNPGKSNEIAVFSGCKLEAGNGAPECQLASVSHGAATETLTTNPLRAEEVENVEGGKVGKKLLAEIFPANAAAGFITLNFTGTCTTFQTKVSGQVVAESVLDNAGQGSIELGQAPQERTSWLTRFPATTIKEVWLIAEGVGKVAHAEVVLLGLEAGLKGVALVLLASTKYAPEPNALWSPLP